MTPLEADILRYLEGKDWASTSGLARHFRKDLSGIELVMRSLLSHGHVEEDARRYYRAAQRGRDDLTVFDDHWIITPFDGSGSRRPI